MHFIRHGHTLRPLSRGSTLESGLKPGYYRVAFSLDEGFHLVEVAPMTVPERLYGNAEARAERIFTTYMSRDVPTGALLLGEKGGGKTMLARKVCVRAVAEGQAVLICDAGSNMTSPGLTHFLASLSFPFVALFDEFEKNFESLEEQSVLLSLMDGLSQSRRLFLLTANNRAKISPFMLDRPGRIFYAFEYNGLGRDVITEYCAEQGVSEADTDAIIAAAEMSNSVSFDVLQAIVEEMKRYGLPFAQAVDGLNVGMDVDSGPWEVLFRIGGDVVVSTHRVTSYQPGKDNSDYIRAKAALSSLQDAPEHARVLEQIFEVNGDSDGDILFAFDADSEKGWDRKTQMLLFSTPYEGLEIGLRRKSVKPRRAFLYG